MNPDWCGNEDYYTFGMNGFNSREDCCACSGRDDPAPGFAYVGESCEANEDKADIYGHTCEDYRDAPHWCGIEGFNTDDFNHNADCCVCLELERQRQLDERQRQLDVENCVYNEHRTDLYGYNCNDY